MTTPASPVRSRVSELVLQVDDLERSTAFWASALDQQPFRASEEAWVAFDLAPGVVLTLLPPTAWQEGASRVHLGLSTDVPADYLVRLARAGVRVQADAPAVVTAPDGLSLVVHRT